jgi:hypothetical protein
VSMYYVRLPSYLDTHPARARRRACITVQEVVPLARTLQSNGV